MIRKFLIIEKRLFLSSAKLTESLPKAIHIDLQLSIEAYQKINELVELADFLRSTQAPTTEIQQVYKKIFKIAIVYAHTEQDRGILADRLGVS
ncbi:MAG: hypothetical protein KA436_00615 [Oligoflexales bacterium]|nr:hypothetical protein [Oligoflexales bacterium]